MALVSPLRRPRRKAQKEPPRPPLGYCGQGPLSLPFQEGQTRITPPKPLPTSALSCSPTHPTNNSSVCIQQASMQIRLKRRTGAGMVSMNWATVHLPALLPVCQRWAASITSRASPASFRSHRPSYENIMDSQTIMCFTVSYIFVLF